MNIIISALILVLGAFGGFTLNKNSAGSYSYDNGGSGYLSLGATNFPTSLDSLTNPSGTDSVATVSHSGQHSNTNDAIEVIEAKLGIGASTAVSGTVFVGDGTGTSRWSTYATTTNVSTTALQSTNILANGSSTLQNFTFVNATGTSATTTNFFATTASSTSLFSASYTGAALSSCTGENKLQWSGGLFSCAADVAASLSIVSTTSLANMATATIRNIPFGNRLDVILDVASTSNQAIRMCFNEDWNGCGTQTGRYAYQNNADGIAAGEAEDATHIILDNGGAGTTAVRVQYRFSLFNSSTSPKFGNGIGSFATSSTLYDDVMSTFVWASTTAAINSISFSINDAAGSNTMGAGTFIKVYVSD